MKKTILFVMILMVAMHGTAYTLNVSDYLIDTVIGEYSKSYDGSCPKGSGVIAGAGHFKIDHIDYACDIRYYNELIDNGIEVQVTQHAGGDSDKWLLHEVEDSFRDPDVLEASLAEGTRIREIDGQKIFFYGVGIVGYRWLNNSIVVNIQYTNLSGPKVEPLEVVKAYLVKHPSTITLTDADIKSRSHNEQWIRDEMDRRLWLCDKWFEQLQLEKVQQKQALQEVVSSMNVFLDYREKYYGLKAENEKNLLSGYLSEDNATSIKAKLQQYKEWWTTNKSGSLLGLLTTCPQRLYGNVSRMFTKLFTFLTLLMRKLLAIFG